MKKLIRYVMALNGKIWIEMKDETSIGIVVEFHDIRYAVFCKPDKISLGAYSMLKHLKKQKRRPHLRLVG